MQKKLIYIMQNSFWGKDTKTSGGDVRFGSIFQRINNRFSENSFIFVNKEGFLFDQQYNLKFKFLITPIFFDKLGIYFSYLLRTIFVIWKLFFLPKNYFFYSLSDFFPDTIPPFLFKNKKNKWIQVIHHIYLHPKKRKGNYIRNSIAYYLQRFSFFLIKKRADKIIIVNSLVKEELITLGFYERKIYISSNAIDINYIVKIPESEEKYEGSFLSRLHPSKGIFELIEIWKNVCIKLPNAKLGIIGGGSERIINSLLVKIKELNLENNINILGFLESEKVHSVLKSSKVFLFPSHEEGWGIAIAEAMACKLPVVIWNLVIYKEVFEDYTIQVEENNINLFSEKVIELLCNDKKRMIIGNRGYKFIKRYSWNNISAKEIEIIDSI